MHDRDKHAAATDYMVPEDIDSLYGRDKLEWGNIDKMGPKLVNSDCIDELDLNCLIDSWRWRFRNSCKLINLNRNFNNV